MKSNSFFRAVLFDLDGVLINSIEAHIHAWQQVFSDFGLNLKPLEIKLREGEKAEVSLDFYRRKYGLKLTIKQKRALIARKRALYSQQAPAHLISEASKLIIKLKRKGFKIALVTGSAADNLKELMAKEEYDAFDILVTSSDYTRPKPHPQCYLMALEKLKLAAADCIAVENAPFGIQSAKSAGLKVIALTSTLTKEYLSEADWIVDDYSQMGKLLF